MNKKYKGYVFATIVSFAVSLCVTCNDVCAQVPCEYDVTIIQAPTDCGIFGTVNTFGLGLNENGAVVGRYKCPVWSHDEAFVWTAEDGFVTLDRPEGVYSASAIDINDNGVICGTAWMFELGQRGFVYDHGKWTILDLGVPGGGWSSASAINNAGVVVGQRSITENLNPQNAYFWSAEKGFTDLGVMNGPNSAARNVNEQGNICGWTGNGTTNSEGFLWDKGIVELLGPIEGGFTSTPSAIAMDGSIVGLGLIKLKGAPIGASRAFLWNNGEFVMLGVLPNHTHSRANDIISTSSQIVGRSWHVDGNPNVAHGFIWENGVMYDLNDLIVPGLQLLIRSTDGISQEGNIIANGQDASGNTVAILLNPAEGLIGDLDNDCDVDLDDLIALLDNWGKHDSAADLNQDGFVNTVDLLILFANWG